MKDTWRDYFDAWVFAFVGATVSAISAIVIFAILAFVVYAIGTAMGF